MAEGVVNNSIRLGSSLKLTSEQSVAMFCSARPFLLRPGIYAVARVVFQAPAVGKRCSEGGATMLCAAVFAGR